MMPATGMDNSKLPLWAAGLGCAGLGRVGLAAFVYLGDLWD